MADNPFFLPINLKELALKRILGFAVILKIHGLTLGFQECLQLRELTPDSDQSRVNLIPNFYPISTHSEPAFGHENDLFAVEVFQAIPNNLWVDLLARFQTRPQFFVKGRCWFHLK